MASGVAAAAERLDGVCWCCGGPASKESAATLVLVAQSWRTLDSQGHPVTRGPPPGRLGRLLGMSHGHSLDKLSVLIPRCARCKRRSRFATVTILGATLAGAVIGTLVQAIFLPTLEPPRGLLVGHEGAGNVGTGIGAVVGFLAALFQSASRRLTSGHRSLMLYPPVRMLQRAGWYFPMD